MKSPKTNEHKTFVIDSIKTVMMYSSMKLDSMNIEIGTKKLTIKDFTKYSFIFSSLVSNSSVFLSVSHLSIKYANRSPIMYADDLVNTDE